ncbi:hypothetical protein ACLB9X_33365 [Streptomyces sp. 5K101]|uniref:hypothetical protein n=1 Tax=Streptomyces sp. 5K101 TaxID=3390037 RepID=UPI0039752A1A
MPQRTHLGDEFGDPIGQANRDTPPAQAVREHATDDRATAPPTPQTAATKPAKDAEQPRSSVR